MNSKSEVELKNFFIFNSTYGLTEGQEHQKILYYFPSADDVNAQVNNVGLVEAIVKFTGNFKPSSSVKSLHTQKKRQLYFQPEPNFWVVMTLNLPFVNKTKEGKNCCEYLEDDIQDNVYEAILNESYSMYRLFAGTFTNTIKNSDLNILKNKLDHFYSAYLKTLKLVYCDILSIFGGIHFLPVDKKNFLNAQCFINLLECNYPFIQFTAFLYNDSLVWSGLEPEDMQIVYQYLIKTLLPAQVETELQGGSMPRNPSTPFASVHYGRFITGPANLKAAKTIEKVPKVYLNNNSTNASAYNMVVYRALSSSICLFITSDTDLSVDLFKELDEFIGPQLTSIASDIAEYCSNHISPTNLSETLPRFIYFNNLNLACKSTVHVDNKQNGNLTCSTEAVKIMADMNKKKSLLGHSGETIVKTMNDFWVVGKLSNYREFYVALQQKNASLINISDELKRLSETELKGIFFHPT